MSIFGDDPSEVIKKQLIILGIIIYVAFIIWASVDKWNTYPKQLICPRQADSCKLITYSYKHQICWWDIFRSKYRHNRCNLPKYKSDETELFPLSDIEDLKIVNTNGAYEIYLVDKIGQQKKIETYKNENDASFRMNFYKKLITEWQDTVTTSEEYSDEDFVGNYTD